MPDTFSRSPDVGYAPTVRSPTAETQARLIIVSNRLPVTLTTDARGVEVQRSVGGLAAGLRAPHARAESVWVGWPGDLQNLEPVVRDEIGRQLAAMRIVPVALTAREARSYYDRLCNAVLWPICHDRLDQLPLHVGKWDVYETVNQRFADAVAALHRPGDLIWIHDYHLMRLPALLRNRLPTARIGFFLHVPFPNPEIFFALPTRRWLVEGLLGADVVGFHTRRWRGHFTAALRRLLGIEMDADATVAYEDRRVHLGIFPIGVEAADLEERAAARAVTAAVLNLRSPTQRLLVGIDRLDYSKGILRRLVAFERLLIKHPGWRGRVQLMQIAVPTRTRVRAYRRLRREVDARVGRINGRFATPTWTPVQYVYRRLTETTLLALYRAADVMLVTPLRDGMNLVAKEFVACRSDESGVLVLSEFAGAADELTDALLVNPYDADAVADTMHRALTMDRAERRRRLSALRASIRANDVHHWTSSFLGALASDG
ncbi:MAG TPA: bifunctional alpha,alpha-trehalose-phosphate synthase (UDP-forming)/trehalose-phosphatase [Gemmatimonadaceae bacterium]|jgi:trehalose 6-phosphate synthase/phosphatase